MDRINDFQVWAEKFITIRSSHIKEFIDSLVDNLDLHEMKCRFAEKYQDRIELSYLLGTKYKCTENENLNTYETLGVMGYKDGSGDVGYGYGDDNNGSGNRYGYGFNNSSGIGYGYDYGELHLSFTYSQGYGYYQGYGASSSDGSGNVIDGYGFGEYGFGEHGRGYGSGYGTYDFQPDCYGNVDNDSSGYGDGSGNDFAGNNHYGFEVSSYI